MVQVISSVSQKSHYPPHFLTHSSRSRANFFRTYILWDRLDDPPARLDNFATPSVCYSIKTIVTLHLECCFFWRWKAYPMSRSHPPPPQGIYCLQETKSTHTDILKLSHSHIYLSGSPDDSHAGVGFAIPTPLPDCRCRFAMQLSLLCSLFLYYSGHFIS